MCKEVVEVTKVWESWRSCFWTTREHNEMLGLRSGQGLEASLQAVQRAGRAGGGGGFTDVNSEVDTTVNGVVVLVRRRGLAGVLCPPPGGIIVRVIDEGDTRCGVVYPKLRVCHEVVYRCSGVRFFQAFVEGATECIYNSDLL